ncbi:MAG: UPF0158 family protein [Chitinophagaceae bacterium]
MANSHKPIILTNVQIKDIAQDFDCGFCCYIHKESGKIITIPDMPQMYDMDVTPFEEDLDELEENMFDYFEIERMTSHDSFEVMEQFAEQVTNNRLQDQLFNTLNQKKPFSKFKFVVEDSGSYRQEWFDFKAAKLQQWVKGKVDRYNREMDTLDELED